MDDFRFSNGPTPPKPARIASTKHDHIHGSFLDELPLFEAENFNVDDFVDRKCCSMNEKALRRLYGELIEQRRISTEEMRRSVYSNYAAFIRTSREISELEGELNAMRNLLTLQADLIHKLAESAQSSHTSPIFSSLKVSNSEASDLFIDLPDLNPAELEAESMPDMLDNLIAERKVKEAIELLEKGQNMILQSQNKHSILLPNGIKQVEKFENEVKGETKLSKQFVEDEPDQADAELQFSLSESIYSSLSGALAERRVRMIEMLSEFVKHPSVQGEELRNSIRYLDRLGESFLAHTLLLSAHCERVKNQVRSLRPSGTSYGNAYTSALTQLVFSAISQAAKDSASIFPSQSSMASEFVLWSHKLTEWCAELLQKHVLSSSNAVGGLNTAAECARISLNYCQLLESIGLTLSPVLMKYMKPSVQEALQANIWRIEESVAAMISAEEWTLYHLHQSGKGNKLFGSMDNIKLSSSGQRFFLLLQDFVDDLTPVINLRLSNSILDNIAYLFESYCSMLRKALPGTSVMEEEEDEEEHYTETKGESEREPMQAGPQTQVDTASETEDEKGNESKQLNNEPTTIVESKEGKHRGFLYKIEPTNVKMAVGETQQLALLANASALADELLPRFALKLFTLMDLHSKDSSRTSTSRRSNSFNELRRATSRTNSEQSEWRRRLQKAVDKLRDALCSSLLNDFIFDEDGKLLLTVDEYLHRDVESDPYTWQNNPMPTKTFQALFVAIENIRVTAEGVLADREKVVTLFLMRLAEWLLSGLLVYSQFWEHLEGSELPISACGLQQLVFDMYFVMHIAQIGRYFSRGVKKVTYESMTRAVNLYKEQTGEDPGGFLQTDEWFKHQCEIACEKVKILSQNQISTVDLAQEAFIDPPDTERAYRKFMSN